MTYLVSTWGGNDNPGGTYGTFDISSTTSGLYPAARITSAGTYPVYITNVGAYISATGTSSAAGVTGHYVLGTVTTNGFTGGVSNTGTTFVNAGLKYDGVTNGALVYSGSSAVSEKFTWVNTSTWGVWAGRDTNTGYTTVYGSTSRAGRMGGAVTYYLAPSAPTAITATTSTDTVGKINIIWTVPAEDGGSGTNGTSTSEINAYSIYRSTTANGTYTLVEKVTASIALSKYNTENNGSTAQYTYGKYSDTSTKTTGTLYYYKIAAHNLVTDKISSTTAGALSTASSGAVPAAAPSAPASISIYSKVGRTVIVSYSDVTVGGDSGNSIIEYRMQVSTDNGTTWNGWDNTTKSFITTGNRYNVVSSGSFTYQQLTPALNYLFRVYAVNSIGDGSSISTDPQLFVSAGGRRVQGPSETNPGTLQPTTIAKRYDAINGWTDLTIAKRYDPTNPNAINGWVDLS